MEIRTGRKGRILMCRLGVFVTLSIVACGALPIVADSHRKSPEARSMALQTPAVDPPDGRVVAWGLNIGFKLGDARNQDTQRPIPGRVASLSGATDIAANDDYSCAVIAGVARCWGAFEHEAWTGATASSNEVLRTAQPIAIPKLTGVAQVALGLRHGCALVGNGTVSCWGGVNLDGELGHGPPWGFIENPVAVAGISGAKQIVAGALRTCVLRADGGVICWGGRRPVEPVAELVGVTHLGSNAKSNNFCAVLADGTVTCWGANDHGQLGRGTIGAEEPRPAPVVGVNGARQVALGADHACALLADGTVQCWGSNVSGQIGRGDAGADQPKPAPVPGVSGARQVVAGADYTCALLATGRVQCWGNDLFGELGDGAINTSRPSPVRVSGLDAVSKLAAGPNHMLAIR